MDMGKKKVGKFEDLLRKAEVIVGELEDGGLDLADAISKYQDGIAALKKCYEILKKAEGKVEMLKCDDDGNITLEPFRADDAD